MINYIEGLQITILHLTSLLHYIILVESSINPRAKTLNKNINPRASIINNHFRYIYTGTNYYMCYVLRSEIRGREGIGAAGQQLGQEGAAARAQPGGGGGCGRRRELEY